MLNKKLITLLLGSVISLQAGASEAVAPLVTPVAVKEAAVPLAIPVAEELKFKASVSDTILKTFAYSPTKVYEIRSRTGMWTVITLEDDEITEGVYLSDTTFWSKKVTTDQRRVMVRPTEPGRFNSGTLVTNKRTYELVFKSYGEGSSWFQRVTWKFNEDADPAFGIFKGNSMVPAMPGSMSESRAESTKTVEPDDAMAGWTVDISKANFNYTIENSGSAPFAPTRVFDDGTFTYIKMPKVQDLPVVFAIGRGGKIRLVDYVVKNNYILVQRVLPGILLRLDEQEVTVVRHE